MFIDLNNNIIVNSNGGYGTIANFINKIDSNATALNVFVGSSNQVCVMLDASLNGYIYQGGKINKYYLTIFGGNNSFTAFAGNGSTLISAYATNVLATATSLNQPNVYTQYAIYNNYFYLADKSFHIIRRINMSTNIITLVAGTAGTSGSAGDGGNATSCNLNLPCGIAFDSIGNLYISDGGNNKIRMINVNGIISTLVLVSNPNQLLVDINNNLIICGNSGKNLYYYSLN